MTQVLATEINKPEILTVRQAARRGVLPEKTLRHLVASGKIPVIRSGRTQYLNFSALVAQLATGEGLVWQ